MRVTLEQVLKATGGELIGNVGSEEFTGVAADSRKVPPGSLFVAIRGAINDGHDFIADVARAGASAVLVDKWPLNLPPDVSIPAIKTTNSLYALGELARSIRLGLKAKVAALTGTAGKTTTKEMTVAILKASVGPVFSSEPGFTQGSENNLVGVPMTILGFSGNESAIVLEMGMNALGEIARLTEIAGPDMGLVTNIGLAHLKPSSSSLSMEAAPKSLNSLEGVIHAKGELWAGMRADGLTLLNLDDSNVRKIAEGRSNRLTYSRLDATADLSIENARHSETGQTFTLIARGERFEVTLAAQGEHNLSNALGAAAIATGLGVPPNLIAEGLANFRPVKMRGEIISIGPDIVCINDAYNANPLSMAAALKTLAGMPGSRRIAALGDMKELGDKAKSAHVEIGALAAELHIDYLLTVGEYSKDVAGGAKKAGMRPARISRFESPEQVGVALEELLRSGDRVLLKASRAIGLEKALRIFRISESH